jgi:hypothetical protein
MKVAFTPISLIAGLLAGSLAKKLFDAVWGVFDDEEAPEPKHRDVDRVKLVVALLVQGATFRLVRGLVDHGLRHAVARATGTWPGEEVPDRH